MQMTSLGYLYMSNNPTPTTDATPTDAEPRYHFITICTLYQHAVFGEVVDGEMNLNAAGQMAVESWRSTEQKYPQMTIDALVVMPNHTHAVLLVTGDEAQLEKMVQWYKSITENAYQRGVSLSGWRPLLANNLWQRGFDDHQIGTEAVLNHMREDIANNATRWEFDRYFVQG